MAIDRESVIGVIYDAIDELNEQLPDGQPVGKSKDTVLFGKGTILDSMGLVHLIMDVEQAIFDKFGVSVTLASEKALASERSPFRTVSSLADFVIEFLQDEPND